MDEEKYKPVFVENETHQRIKTLAAMSGVNMYELVKDWADAAWSARAKQEQNIPTPTAG